MNSRDTTKLEYLKQPHILAITFFILIIAVAAVLTATKRVKQTVELSNMQTFDACIKLVEDDNLCKFVANNEGNSSNPYVMTISETTGPQTTTSVIEIESNEKSKTTTYSGEKETDSTIVIGNTVYFKDYTDSKWAFYTNPEYQSSAEESPYDFSSEISNDVQNLRNNYKFEGIEACGEQQCFKYKIPNEEESTDTYLWFDDKEYKTRKIMDIYDESTVISMLEYKPVLISEPSPIKEVDQEQLQQYLQS